MSQPRILLVEDNDQNAYLVRFLLEKENMFVRRASTGLDGLAAARAEKPDLILLDIQLPDLDGYELAKILRQDATFADVAIVALTSFAMPAEREKALALGCNGYIEKPIAPLLLAGQVRSFLKR
jgi:CheY-like chemotaxis protein